MWLNPKALLYTSFFFSNAIIAQDKLIDSAGIYRWYGIDPNYSSISNNGTYFTYRVANNQDGHTLLIQGTDNSWKMEVPSGDFLFFQKKIAEKHYTRTKIVW